MILNKAVKITRTWIQWNAYNGSTVEWGSYDALNLKQVRVVDLEMLAMEIHEAYEKEIKGLEEKVDYLQECIEDLEGSGW